MRISLWKEGCETRPHREWNSIQISSTLDPANKLWRNEYDKYLKAIFYVGIDAYSDTNFLDR